MKTAVTKIAARTLLIVGVFALAVTAASIRGNDPGVTLACNGIDLKIDSKATYNGALVPSGTWALKDLLPGVDKFFNFDDIKPGDQGENTVSIHIKNSPAWVCLDFKNVLSNDNGQNEPESLSDSNGNVSGELASGMEFFSWFDDGDNIFELGEKPIFGTTTQSTADNLNEKTYPICDTSTGTVCNVNQTKYFGIYWCAGNLEVNVSTATITCDGTVLGNEAQTDSMSVDISLRAYPTAEYPSFRCDGKTEETPTRTLGFWQTHTAFTSTIFASSSMQKFIGVNSPPVAGSHKGTITNIQSSGASQLFGAYYASIPKKTNGTNRSATDKKRIQLLQQLITAKLNCAAVACSADTLNLITSADTAYKNGSGNMITLAGQLDAYNNSGDLIPLPTSLGSQGSATPGLSQSLANKAFWNAP